METQRSPTSLPWDWSCGLTHRNGIPFGTWQDRYIDWFRDLGFLQKPGVETKAAQEVKTFVNQSPRVGGRRGTGSGGN